MIYYAHKTNGAAVDASSNMIYLLYIMGIILAVRSYRNRWKPMLYVLVSAILWVALQNVLTLVGIDIYLQIQTQMLVAAIFVALALIVQLTNREADESVEQSSGISPTG